MNYNSVEYRRKMLSLKEFLQELETKRDNSPKIYKQNDIQDKMRKTIKFAPVNWKQSL